MKRAFILSDCEPPLCEEKPYALLTANVTKGHHFIAQTEQRQHAFNRGVNPQNQNVYRLPLSLFHKPYKGKAESVNIENNLEINNLYTLSFVEGSGGSQYNLESWFSRHESGYEEASNMLRTVRPGKQKVPEALWRILRLKLLGIFRNPYNHNTSFVHDLHQAVLAQLPEVSSEFVKLIEQRPQPRLGKILTEFAFTPDSYTRWLANLYGMLSEGVMQPSLFERLFAALFADSNSVKIELYSYTEESDCCLFPDTGFCAQISRAQFSIGVSVAADMFAIVHLQRSRWNAVKNNFADHLPKPTALEVNVIENNQQQRATFNRLCIRHAREAVFGRSNHRADYF
ncbi:hypothetical protein [Neisseria zoodegmatis]|uniref:DUF4238 domain-containing protein n=1 Tax=Neisseria zoodegmatis TaxID=326523 RepID=A0AB38DT26_9NEIS|nr:hypothetical protein [Neisseria zoodegmatis]OSI08523.1 hypothetical protein BWD10_11460 [Neisseria zoodegmatis]SNU80392.1 Uncharacterised protein [Neisseria zoodegmatis]